MKVVILSQLVLLISWLSVADIEARSTQVSAQYTVGDGNGDVVSNKRFIGRGIVEDEVLEDVGGYRNYKNRPARNASRIHKKRAPITPAPVYDDTYEPEFFAVKGKVLDEEERTAVSKPRNKPRKTATSQTKFSIVHPLPSKNPSKSNFRFPSINNEEIFESKLLESSSTKDKQYKNPTDQLEDDLYAYSKQQDFGEYTGKSKAKNSKKSSQYVEDDATGSKRKYQEDVDDQDDDEDFGGHFRPSTKFQQQSSNQKFPSKLFKSEQDEFKDSDDYDYPTKSFEGKVNKQKPIFVSAGGKLKKANNKFDPQMQGGFKPSAYKLREISSGYNHGADAGHGLLVAGPGQIKNYYNLEENTEESRGKSPKNGSPASRAQFQQFLKAKEDERIERIVEEQFKLQQQKQIQSQKEKELQQQQQILQVQKQKLKEAEKQLNGKATRQKRRPNQPGSSQSSGARRQRNPSPLTYAGAGNSGSPPKRTVASKDGSYRVSFNIQ